MYNTLAYIIYLSLALFSVLVVGRLLYTNGRFYLVEIFHNEKIADAVNRFLITGYCLVNVGGAFRCLHKTDAFETFQQCVEYVFTNQGELFLLLGIMHCMNLIFLPLLKPIFKQHHNHSNENQPLR
jgi:urea transporter